MLFRSLFELRACHQYLWIRSFRIPLLGPFSAPAFRDSPRAKLDARSDDSGDCHPLDALRENTLGILLATNHRGHGRIRRLPPSLPRLVKHLFDPSSVSNVEPRLSAEGVLVEVPSLEYPPDLHDARHDGDLLDPLVDRMGASPRFPRVPIVSDRPVIDADIDRLHLLDLPTSP